MKVLLIAKKLKMGKPDHGTRWHGETFREVLGKFCDLTYVNTWPLSVSELVDELKPDVVISHFQSWADFGSLKIPTVHLMPDYCAMGNQKGDGFMLKYDEFLRQSSFDLIVDPVLMNVEMLRAKKLAPRIEVLPFSIDTTVCYDMELDRDIEVSAMYANREKWLYPNRRDIIAALEGLQINSFLENKRPHPYYMEIINRSKVFVSGLPIGRNISTKWPEVMVCGTLLMSDRPDELDLLGYKDGTHLVIFEDIEDMKEKLFYYLKHEEERERIAKAGQRFALENFTHEAVAQQLFNLIEEIL